MHIVDEVMTGEDTNPKVSIIIPVYNGSNYLREAIDSAINQTYNNLEIIVINDGSDDGGMTEKIVYSYGDRIRYCRKENGGVASALNEGIRWMSGEFFSWLSHDDVYYPEKVEVQIAQMRQLLRPAVLYGDYELIDGQSRILSRMAIRHVAPSEFRKALICDNPIHGCSALIPRGCFENVGMFDERFRTTQDYDLWFRMAQAYDFIHMPVVLLKSREHAGQGTVTMSELHIRECNDFLLSGMRQLVAELLVKEGGREAASMFMSTCAISFTRRGFSQAAKKTFMEVKKMSGVLKLLANSRYRTFVLSYLSCSVQRLCQQMRLLLLSGRR